MGYYQDSAPNLNHFLLNTPLFINNFIDMQFVVIKFQNNHLIFIWFKNKDKKEI